MATLQSVTYEWDGQPSACPEDARAFAQFKAEQLSHRFETKHPISVYMPACADNDFPKGTWTYDKPASRGRWHARFQQ